MNRYCFLVIILLALTTKVTLAQKKVVFEDNHASLDISEFIYLYKDPTGVLSIDEIIDSLFVLNTEKSLNMRRTNDAVWIRFSFGSKVDDNLILELKNPLIQSIDFYVIDPNSGSYQHKKLGTSLPFKERFYQTTNFIFPLPNTTKDAFTTVYLRIKSKSILPIPLSLKTHQVYIEESHTKDTIIGIYIGLCYLWGVCRNI
jgi:two-component system, sensor histidine kinase LadS